MTNKETIDILLSNRPERPRSLTHKKLQSGIDSAIALLNTQSDDLRKYTKIQSIIKEWQQDDLRGRQNIDANYFYRILDVVLDMPE